MDVIVGTTCGNQHTIIVSDDATDVLIQPCCDISGDLREVILCAEDDVVVQTGVRMRHYGLRYFRPSRALFIVMRWFPDLTIGANDVRPSRAVYFLLLLQERARRFNAACSPLITISPSHSQPRRHGVHIVHE